MYPEIMGRLAKAALGAQDLCSWSGGKPDKAGAELCVAIGCYR
jgi:hypothetical protein